MVISDCARHVTSRFDSLVFLFSPAVDLNVSLHDLVICRVDVEHLITARLSLWQRELSCEKDRLVIVLTLFDDCSLMIKHSHLSLDLSQFLVTLLCLATVLGFCSGSLPFSTFAIAVFFDSTQDD